MKTINLVVGQMQENCYLAVCEKTGKCLIVDPGDDADLIIGKISQERLEPFAIAATHGHFDHVGAVTELRLAFNVPFYLHQKDWRLAKRSGKTAEYFIGFCGDPMLKPDKYLKEGNLIKFGKERLKIIETPGHTPGGICLYSEKSGFLFAGDTIFADGAVGRTDFSYASDNDLQKSIIKILQLPKKTLIYPGHGKETSVKDEKEYYGK